MFIRAEESFTGLNGLAKLSKRMASSFPFQFQKKLGSCPVIFIFTPVALGQRSESTGRTGLRERKLNTNRFVTPA